MDACSNYEGVWGKERTYLVRDGLGDIFREDQILQSSSVIPIPRSDSITYPGLIGLTQKCNAPVRHLQILQPQICLMQTQPFLISSEASDSIIHSQASSGTLRHLVLRHPQSSSPKLIQLQAAPEPFSIPQPQTLFSE